MGHLQRLQEKPGMDAHKVIWPIRKLQRKKCECSTLGTTTLSIMTLGIVTLGIMTFIIMTLIIIELYVTLGISDSQHK